jgi:hypothetical protein
VKLFFFAFFIFSNVGTWISVILTEDVIFVDLMSVIVTSFQIIFFCALFIAVSQKLCFLYGKCETHVFFPYKNTLKHMFFDYLVHRPIFHTITLIKRNITVPIFRNLRSAVCHLPCATNQLPFPSVICPHIL